MRIRAPLFAPALLAVLLAGCVAAPRPVAPPPRVAPRLPAPPPAPPLGPDWRDWRYTPGTWTYARTGAGSVARFGEPGRAALLTLGCEAAARRVTLTLPGAAAAAMVRTSSATRQLSLHAGADGRPAAVLAAADPLLDAMGFSRGRFVVEQAGSPPLVVPAWAEIGRVTEDCRG